jgi:hypothetical protein
VNFQLGDSFLSPGKHVGDLVLPGTPP